MSKPAAVTSRAGRLVWVVVLGCALAVPAWALHRETPPSVRVTSGSDHHLSASRSWGNFLGFSSTVDLLETGSTGRQIFLFNVAYFDCNRATTREQTPCPKPPLPSLVQLTDRPGSPDNPSVEPKGQYVVFDADGVFGGGGGPQASRRQIFLLNRKNGEIQQITYSAAGDSTRPSMDRLAKVIVFQSTAPLLGQGAPGVSQIYAYFRLARALVQVSDGAGPSTEPAINSRGRQVAFESTAALATKTTTRDGHNTGISQIYVADLLPDGLGVSRRLITNGNASSHHPFLTDRSGDAGVAFDSAATNLFGASGGSGRQIYVAPPDLEGDLPRVETITNRTQFGDCSHPVFSPSAEHLTFICTGDPLQNGTTGNRIFVQDRAKDANPARRFWQITGRGDAEGPIAQSLGEWFIAYAGTADTSGTGACGRQIQIIDYYGGHWNIADDPGEITPDMFDVNQYPGPQSNFIGTRVFDLLDQSDSSPSRFKVTTQSGPSVSSIPERGSLWTTIGPRDLRGEASIAIPAQNVVLPPLPTGNGAYCLTLRGDGEGIIDCDGGRLGGDVNVANDHDTTDVDPTCRNGCFEDDPKCTEGLIGPHPGVCNGTLRRTLGGLYAGGGMVVRLPVHVRFALNPGLNGWCTGGEYDYAPVQLETELTLTTGTVTAAIADADGIPGTAISDLATGVRSNCAELLQGDTPTARLVGMLPMLDFPSPPTFRDAVVTLTLEARARPRRPRAENLLGGHCVATVCAFDADCIDSNLCNGTESCVNQTCAPGTPLCDDGDACNGLEGCNPTTGLCSVGVPPVCDDGNLCTFDTCLPSTGCMHVSTCDDSDACNGPEECDPTTGACGPALAPLDCNDGNDCTTDSCDPVDGCQWTTNTNFCNDTDPCTLGDVCQSGLCRGAPIVCSDNNVCNGVETCQAGACTTAAPLNCDDGNPCTDDTCDGVLGCQQTNNTVACDDSNLCTFNDQCQSGACAGSPVQCANATVCDGNETCNPADGSCLPGTPLPCDDGNACTTDSCDPVLGCQYVPVGGPCLVILAQRAIEETRTDALGGRKAKQRLGRAVYRAARSVTRAEKLRGAPRCRQLRAARAQLKSADGILESGITTGDMDGRLARKLRTLLERAIADLAAGGCA